MQDKAASTSVGRPNSPGLRLFGRRHTGPPCYVPKYWQRFVSALPEGVGEANRHLIVGLLRDDIRATRSGTLGLLRDHERWA